MFVMCWLIAREHLQTMHALVIQKTAGTKLKLVAYNPFGCHSSTYRMIAFALPCIIK